MANLPAVEYTVLLDKGTSLTADAALLTGRRELLPLSRGVVSAALPAQASRQQYRLSRGRFPPVKMKTRRVARFDLRSAQPGPREYVTSCASTCTALPLKRMVNLLEEYEPGKACRAVWRALILGGPRDTMGRATRNGNFVAACNDGVARCPSRTT